MLNLNFVQLLRGNNKISKINTVTHRKIYVSIKYSYANISSLRCATKRGKRKLAEDNNKWPKKKGIHF